MPNTTRANTESHTWARWVHAGKLWKGRQPPATGERPTRVETSNARQAPEP
jgi:hypothetical protein